MGDSPPGRETTTVTDAPTPGPSKGSGPDPLPGWVSVVVVLVLLALLAYNIVIVGPEGYPTSVILGGLLGAYAGVDQLLRKRRDPPGSGD